MSTDRPFFGILLMIAFCALAPLGDAMAKLLGNSVPLFELLTVRFTIQTVLLMPIVWWTGASLRLPRRTMTLAAVRTALQLLGVGTMFTALRFLPLADAIAIAYVMPFLLLALGKLVLGEEIGPRRLIAAVVGFAGTLLVVQPSFAEVGAPALLPLVVAIVFALYMLVTRQLSRDIDPVSMQAVSGLMALPALALVALVNLLLGQMGMDFPELDFILPDRRAIALLVALGVLGTGTHLLMTWSLRFAPSATLAPIQYLEIPFATLIGWLVFKDLPNGLAALGIVVTMSAGLYVVYRERANMQPLPPET